MTDTNKNFPYTAWRLMPSFKPVAVEIVGPYIDRWGGRSVRAVIDAKGKRYRPVLDLYQSKADAIEGAHRELAKRQAAANKVQANIDKKRAEIAKAEAA